MKASASPLYVDGYDLLRWLTTWVEKLPRGLRPLYGTLVHEEALGFVTEVSLALTQPEERLDTLLFIREPKPRVITVSPFPDRVVQHALCRVIEPLFTRSYLPDTFACLEGRGCIPKKSVGESAFKSREKRSRVFGGVT